MLKAICSRRQLSPKRWSPTSIARRSSATWASPGLPSTLNGRSGAHQCVRCRVLRLMPTWPPNNRERESFLPRQDLPLDNRRGWLTDFCFWWPVMLARAVPAAGRSATEFGEHLSLYREPVSCGRAAIEPESTPITIHSRAASTAVASGQQRKISAYVLDWFRWRSVPDR